MSSTLDSQSEIRGMLPAFLQEVRSAKGVLIGTHLNPDGDAIGSALAMSFILDQLDVEHEVLCNDPPPYNLEFLPGVNRIKQQTKGDEHSLGLILDLEARNRLGSVSGYFEECQRIAVIDHHIPHEAPGHLRIVCTQSPATASIILDLITDSEINITPDIADCLLTGILTDTGNFRYPNTDAHSLHAAGLLLEKGANLPLITRQVYMEREQPAVELVAKAISRMKMDETHQIAWVTLPISVFEEVGAVEQHSEGIVNELLSIKGVKIAAVLRESTPGRIRGSLRSFGKIDVAATARQFGGGGHMNAAGVSFLTGLSEAEDTLVKALKRCLESSK